MFLPLNVEVNMSCISDIKIQNDKIKTLSYSYEASSKKH